MAQPDPSATRILIADLGAPHGVRGEIRIRSFAAEPEALASYGALEAADGRVFEIERLYASGAHLVARIKGVADRDQAAMLTGTELYIDRAALPAPDDADDFYHADLIGLAAETLDGTSLGTVISVQNFGAGDLLEIAPPRGAPLLVPFTKAAVPEVDLKGGRLRIDPLPGLLTGDDDDEPHDEEGA